MLSARTRRHLTRRLARLEALVADLSLCPRHRKRAARGVAAIAERLGLLRRPARCEGCSQRRPLTRHHPDHSWPLQVVYLCWECHALADGRVSRAAG